MKRLTCLILMVLCMLFALHAMADSGEFGGGTWTMDENGVLTFTGPADLTKWKTNGTDFQNTVTRVVYGPEVTGVVPGAYSYAYNLTAFEVDPENPSCKSVDGVLYSRDGTQLIEAPTGMTGSYTIPEGVKEIGESAFIGSALTELKLPESLEKIDRQAFWNAEFKSLHIPAKTTDIEASALNLHGIEVFTVAEGNPAYMAKDGVLFSYDGTELIHYPVADSREEYTVPAGVARVGYNSFPFAVNLKKLTLQEGVTAFGSSALNYCSNLEEVFLPSTLATIDYGVFRTTTALKTVHFAGTTEAWGKVQTGEDNVMLKRCTVQCADGNVEPPVEEGTAGEGVSWKLDYKTGELTVSGEGTWESNAFNENMAIVKAVLEEGVSEIGTRAFAFCRSLTEVTIPSSVVDIGNSAFQSCSALTKLTIPVTVKALGYNAFVSCDALSEITYGGTKAQWEALREGVSDPGLDRVRVVCTDGTIGGSVITPSFLPRQVYSTYYMAEGAGFEVIRNGVYMADKLMLCSLIAPLQDVSTAEWTLEHLEGSAKAEIIWNPEGDQGFREIRVTQLPEYPEEDIWRVKCTFGGQTWEKEFTVEFREVPTLPEGVERAAEGAWTVQTGMPIDIHEPFRFINGWTLEGIEPTSETYNMDENSFEPAYDENDIFYLKAGKPGTYSCDIMLTCGNLKWIHPTELVITEGKPCGAEGDNVTWDRNAQGLMTMQGTGAIADYATSNPPWRFESDEIRKAVIGEGVTHIGVRTFWYATQLSEVTIPSTVTSIGENAFGFCSALTLVRFGGTREQWAQIDISETGNEALQGATILYGGPHDHQAVTDEAVEATETEFGWTAGSHCSICGEILVPQERIAPVGSIASPEGTEPEWVIRTDGTMIFYGKGRTGEYDSEDNPPWYAYRDKITSVILEEGITRIGDYAFYGCDQIRQVTMTDSVVSMGDGAFQGCSALSELKLSDALKDIGELAFMDCTSLSSVTLPSALQSIGYMAFMNSALSSVSVLPGTDVKTWDFFYATEDGENRLYHLDLPSGVSGVSSYAFYGNPLAHDVPDFVLPGALTVIEAEAFKDSKARFVWLPESITAIEEGAFAGCTDLAYIYIPYGCASIGENALPEGVKVLGIDGYDDPYRCEAQKYAEENGLDFVGLEDPYGGNG